MPDEIKALLEEQSQTFEAVKGSIERLDGRCDAIETAFKRTPKTNGGNDPTLEAKQANKFSALIKGEPLMARSETGGMDLNSYREDFALELRARLEARIAPGALRLVQCWTERGRAHLVLAIDTLNKGTLIADNRRPLQHWTTLNYRFLGGVTEVPGRQLWAWNIRAPTLADLLKPRGES